MNCKLRITCKVCRCSMEFSTKGSRVSGAVTCQSCGQVLASPDRVRLDCALEALRDLPAETSMRNGCIKDNEGFIFDIVGTINPEND